jgi:AbrB family looped-hinge helix DNA binding protein
MKAKPFQDITSFGIATVGKRGQVVIPAGIRKKLGVKTGEKFIVFLGPSSSVVFVSVKQFGRMISEFDKKLAKFKKLVK